MDIQVGRFKCRIIKGQVIIDGPAEYIEAKRHAWLLNDIVAGRDVRFLEITLDSRTAEEAILRRLEEDYQAWMHRKKQK